MEHLYFIPITIPSFPLHLFCDDISSLILLVCIRFGYPGDSSIKSRFGHSVVLFRCCGLLPVCPSRVIFVQLQLWWVILFHLVTFCLSGDVFSFDALRLMWWLDIISGGVVIIMLYVLCIFVGI